MSTFIKIGEAQMPAVITGRLTDGDWDNRASKAIRVEMTYADALALFNNNIEWFILQDKKVIVETTDDEGKIHKETKIETETYDNSEYSIAGDIIDHRDGTITVKMGKPTAEEMLAEMASIAAELEYQNMLAMPDQEV